MNQAQTMNPEQGVNAIEKYGINLAQLAKEGKIDPVIGREEEIRRVLRAGGIIYISDYTTSFTSSPTRRNQ